MERLGTYEVHDEELNEQPDVVNNEVLPSDVLHGDRVDVVVEEQGQVDEEEHDSHTTGTDLEGKNLDGVSDKKTGPSQVVAGVVKEDHGDNRDTRALILALLRELGADGPDNEDNVHTTGGSEEERATAELIDEHGHGTSNNHVPDLKTSVDDKLVVLALRVSDHVENVVHVVRDQAVP